jgi:hypothetical protein
MTHLQITTKEQISRVIVGGAKTLELNISPAATHFVSFNFPNAPIQAPGQEKRVETSIKCC